MDKNIFTQTDTCFLEISSSLSCILSTKKKIFFLSRKEIFILFHYDFSETVLFCFYSPRRNVPNGIRILFYSLASESMNLQPHLPPGYNSTLHHVYVWWRCLRMFRVWRNLARVTDWEFQSSKRTCFTPNVLQAHDIVHLLFARLEKKNNIFGKQKTPILACNVALKK